MYPIDDATALELSDDIMARLCLSEEEVNFWVEHKNEKKSNGTDGSSIRHTSSHLFCKTTGESTRCVAALVFLELCCSLDACATRTQPSLAMSH